MYARSASIGDKYQMRDLLLVPALVIAVAAGACNAPTSAAQSEAASAPLSATPSVAASHGTPAALNAQLAQLRRLLAPFHNFDKAVAAGYGVQATGCRESAAGGMGYHYANVALIDGTASLLEPELLLYEPQANGRLRLVAVEYIVPDTEPQPSLLGQDFHLSSTDPFWILHVWVFRHNPSGIFEDWNPVVTCEHAG